MRYYYDELELTPRASQEQIVTAFRAKAKLIHPDLAQPETEEKGRILREDFSRLKEAFDVLSDVGRRQVYDRVTGRLQDELLIATIRAIDPSSLRDHLSRYLIHRWHEVQTDHQAMTHRLETVRTKPSMIPQDTPSGNIFRVLYQRSEEDVRGRLPLVEYERDLIQQLLKLVNDMQWARPLSNVVRMPKLRGTLS